MYPYVLFWNVNWNSIFLATSSCPLYYSAKYITKLQVEGKDIMVLSPESHSSLFVNDITWGLRFASK